MDDSYRDNSITKKLTTKSSKCDVLRDIGKLRHIPRNLEGHAYMQGFALTQERPNVYKCVPLADLETLCKQKVKDKAEQSTARLSVECMP